MFLIQFLITTGFILTTLTALNIKSFAPSQDVF